MKKLSLLLTCALAFGLSACDEVSKVTSPTEKAATVTVAAPVFSPAGGSFSKAQIVSMTSPTASTVIYYTLDGSTPTVASLPYIAPITITANVTIKAIAVTTTTGSSSEVTSASFLITGTAVDSAKDTTKTPVDTTKKDTTIVPPVTTDVQRVTGSWIGVEDGSVIQLNLAADGGMSAFFTNTYSFGVMYARMYGDWSLRDGWIIRENLTLNYTIDSGETWQNEPDVGIDSIKYSFAGDSLITGEGESRQVLVRMNDTIVEPELPTPTPTPGPLATEILGTWSRFNGDYVTSIEFKDDGSAMTFMASIDTLNPWYEVITGEWALSGDSLRMFNGAKMTSTDGVAWSIPVAEEDQTAAVSLRDGELVVDYGTIELVFARDISAMAGRKVAGRAAGSSVVVPSITSRNFLGL